jgi:TfoX/Sxy family transcriptional regulator of competence genes
VSPADPARDVLADRIRAALRDKPTLSERRMFGVVSFLIDDRMVVGARKDGWLLVRVDTGRSDTFLSRPGARIADMGAGRSMGPSWIEVDPKVLDNDTFTFWVGAALDFNARDRV